MPLIFVLISNTRLSAADSRTVWSRSFRRKAPARACASASAFVPRVSFEFNFGPRIAVHFFNVQPSSRIVARGRGGGLARKLVSKVILSRGYMKLTLTSFPTERELTSAETCVSRASVYWNRLAILNQKKARLTRLSRILLTGNDRRGEHYIV